MAFTYTASPETVELDEFRFLIGDTIATEPVLQDSEINYILNKHTNFNTRMYRLFEAASNAFARDIKKSLGPQSQDPTERLKHFKEQAKYYKKLSISSNITPPIYASDAAFRKGLHDNV